MKKFLLLGLMLSAIPMVSSATPKTFGYNVIGTYDNTSYDVPNYFVQLSDSESAKYDPRKGEITINTGYVLQLDMYNTATDPIALQAGTYTASSDNTAGTYDPDYSMLSYYENGKKKGGDANLTSPITVTLDANGTYTVTTTADDPAGNGQLEITYTGLMPFNNSKDKPSSFVHLRKDLDVTLDKGGIAFYQGTSDLSNNGVTYLNLYSAKFNDGGGLVEDGINLAMMVAHKRFAKRDQFDVIPGTYTESTKLDRDTWYPCREIEYSLGNESIAMPFGSFIRIRSNGEYVYGYLKTGTFTIEKDGNGNVKGTLDAYTDLGYHVTATFSGPMALDASNASFKTGNSNLIDDVDLDFSKLEKGYINHEGLKGGCRTFVVDLGSWSDESIARGGDMMRLEFLAPTNTSVLKPGLYTVVPQRWNSNELLAGGTYEPMSLNKGYFNGQGLQIGTRYAHNEDGRNWVWDYVAPIESGTVKVDTEDYKTYHFEINLVDDIGFEVRGEWNKPLEYLYDAENLDKELSGITTPTGAADVKVVLEGRNIVVLNGGNAAITLYDLNGRTVATGNAAEVLDASAFGAGIYVLTINNQSIKIALK